MNADAPKRRVRVIYPVWVPAETVAEDIAVQIPAHLVRPGIEVEFASTRPGAALLDSYYDIALADMFVLEAGLRAAADGVDAICINTTSDCAVAALRSRLTIPVIGPGQASFHLACMLGKKFSIVTMWDRWFVLFEKTLDEYKLWGRLASMRATNTGPDVQGLLAGREHEIFPKIEAECLKAIEEDGADVIVIGSTTMHRAAGYLQDRLPVPVINPGLVAHKIAEMFLELGLGHSKKAYPDPTVPNDARIFDTLGRSEPGT